MAHSTVTSPQLYVSDRIKSRLDQGELSQSQFDSFEWFLTAVDRILLHHRIITHNRYTRWFQKGEVSDRDLCHFVQQFSVFSNQFLVAALLKVINAPTLQQSRSSREILLNELGVIYHQPDKDVSLPRLMTMAEMEHQGDPELVSTAGTVDGGVCRFRAAHFEWLLDFAKGLGLGFSDLGQCKLGRPTTLLFCNELKRLYGSEDPQIAQGASFAVEHWAAAGFWRELIDGLNIIRSARYPNLRLAFFTWHDQVEAQHAGHTLEELELVYFQLGFDPTKFFQGGSEILDAIAVFWDGLKADVQLTSADSDRAAVGA